MSLQKNNHIKIALVGNPNAGKSSLFNAITGLNQRTGNYAGVTVDKFEGETKTTFDGKEYSISIIDLPGIYSLHPKTLDEKVACQTLLNQEDIDVVVLVADAGNLKRNLFLATQVTDLKFNTVLVLNMIDEAERQGIKIDIDGLEKTFGIQVIPVNSRKREGIEPLKKAILEAKPSTSYFHDPNQMASIGKTYRQLVSEQLEKEKDETDKFFASDRLYKFNLIKYIIERNVKSPEKLLLHDISNKIDKIATHKIFGYALLLAILFLVFQFIFYVAEYPMGWIESFFMYLQEQCSNLLPKGVLNDLVANGIMAGISGVFMFVPQIALLFFFIGFLEDSGYMARASFIMDKIMRKFGLNGRSVIPLISGTACAVPSIMATRSISNFKERLITVFILPLISCSARLPVYTLVIALIYPNDSFLWIFNVKGLVLMAVYLLGFLFTLITAFFLSRIIKTNELSFFIMEMPVYRIPQLRNISIMVLNKLKVFIFDAGKIILAISVVLWFLSTNGPGDEYKTIEKKIEALELNKDPNHEIQSLKTQKLESSYVGILGKKIEPVIEPLGFDWKIGISLITSFAAREVFVGTMATIYGTEDDENGIKDRLLKEKTTDGKPLYTPAVCWSLLMFYAFALQCMSTIATVKRETGTWKWAIAQLIFMTALAYLASWSAFSLNS